MSNSGFIGDYRAAGASGRLAGNAKTYWSGGPDAVFNPPSQPLVNNLLLTVFDGQSKILETSLGAYGKTQLTIGRSPDNDICLSSAKVVGRHHATLSLTRRGWVIVDHGSKNGIVVNGKRCPSSLISPGDIVTIGAVGSPQNYIVLAFGYENMRWHSIPVIEQQPISIGRQSNNSLVLASPTISKRHATICKYADGRAFVFDHHSYNGTYVMGRPVIKHQLINPGDIISLSFTPMLYTGYSLLYSSENRGVEITAYDLVQIRKSRGGDRVTSDHISLHIGSGEFVAIIGGSGSGKSTLLNALNGSDPATYGSVFVNGIDLYANYNYLKTTIGYVPQQDIVYDNLTLFDMLRYAAELRMPPDFTKAEREQRALEVIDLLELEHEKDNLIKRLSGGQKKRASIAVELLADPHLLFLDEPTSGLDPGIERDLMQKLARMSADGRTVVLVTHTTLNLNLCSKVVFLGTGGKLCYEGPPKGALTFFGVDDFVEIYDIITSDPDSWAARFAQTRSLAGNAATPSSNQIAPNRIPSFGRQLSTLSRRYARLIVNDTQRLALLLLQAPALAALICLVAGNDCFQICENTKSCLFALSCAAFWVGILDSIQEVCKERAVLRREYAGGLRLSSYLLSKMLVLGLLCLIQSGLLTGVFCLMIGLPSSDPLFFHTGLELFITISLLTLSAMCLGLWVSTLFSNPDRAIAMAPILIMPQVLFSGLIFSLDGIVKSISTIVNCRWAMEALGTTSDVNSLDLAIYGEEISVDEQVTHIDQAEVDVPDTTTEYMGTEIEVPGERRTLEDFDVTTPATSYTIDGEMYKHDPDMAYEHVLPHLLFDWGVLCVFCVVCALLSGVTLWWSLSKRGR